jgi:hypothetical protein
MMAYGPPIVDESGQFQGDKPEVRKDTFSPVTSAKAGVHASTSSVSAQWIPAFAGMTIRRIRRGLKCDCSAG